MRYEPYHEVRYWDKVEALASMLAANGWQGAPLVRWGEYNLITGVHRLEAWLSLGLPDDEIPVIDLEDVFAEAGLDFEALHAEYGYPTIGEHGLLVGLLEELPQALRDKYGIDLH